MSQSERATRSEYSANQALQDSTAIGYSSSWLKPSKHAYQYKRVSWLHRLIVWIAGF